MSIVLSIRHPFQTVDDFRRRAGNKLGKLVHRLAGKYPQLQESCGVKGMLIALSVAWELTGLAKAGNIAAFEHIDEALSPPTSASGCTMMPPWGCIMVEGQPFFIAESEQCMLHFLWDDFTIFIDHEGPEVVGQAFFDFADNHQTLAYKAMGEEAATIEEVDEETTTTEESTEKESIKEESIKEESTKEESTKRETTEKPNETSRQNSLNSISLQGQSASKQGQPISLQGQSASKQELSASKQGQSASKQGQSASKQEHSAIFLESTPPEISLRESTENTHESAIQASPDSLAKLVESTITCGNEQDVRNLLHSFAYIDHPDECTERQRGILLNHLRELACRIPRAAENHFYFENNVAQVITKGDGYIKDSKTTRNG